MTTRLDFQALGPLEVTREGEAVDLGPYKQKSLLALLLADVNRVVSTDRIMDALWGDDADGKEKTLWAYISRLRSALEPDRTNRGESSILLTKDPGYMLAAEPETVDVLRFEHALWEARDVADSDPAAAVELLDCALAMWRGDAFADFAYEDFARNESGRLAELKLEAQELSTECRLQLGQAGELISALEALTRENPYRERPVGQLMTALYRSGRQAEALRAFERHRRIVVEELGIEPSPDLRLLEEQILLHDDRLTTRDREPDGVLVAKGDRSNPYKGLHAFDETDEQTFFGREHLVAELLRRLDGGDRLLAVAPGSRVPSGPD